MTVIIPPYDTQTVRKWFAFRELYDAEWRAAFGNASQITRRVTGLAAQATTYAALVVPSGVQFVLFSRGLNLGEGLYHVDVVAASGGFDLAGATAFLKQPLNGNAAVESSVYAGAVPIGTVTELTNDVVDNGAGPGGQSVSGSTDIEGVTKTYGAGAAALRIRQISVGPGPWYYNLDIIGWEIPA